MMTLPASDCRDLCRKSSQLSEMKSERGESQVVSKKTKLPCFQTQSASKLQPANFFYPQQMHPFFLSLI
jgi:hypothetical protein